MTPAMDLTVGSLLERGADLAFLLMLGAMIVFAAARTRRQGGLAPRVLAWSSVVALAIAALRFLGGIAQEALRSATPARETPDLPISYETWVLLGALAVCLTGVALLTAGGALVVIGIGEAKSERGQRKQAHRRKRA